MLETVGRYRIIFHFSFFWWFYYRGSNRLNDQAWINKMSHYHYTILKKYKERVLQLGEESW